MAGCHHDTTVYPVILTTENGKIHFLGAAKADINNSNTGISQNAAQSLNNLRTGQPHVPAHNDLTCVNLPTKCQSDAAGKIAVQFRRDTSPNIIGSKTMQNFGHGLSPEKQILKMKKDAV
jgi:hypothetical protein